MAYNHVLFEFIPDNLNGRVWNAYDLTSHTGQEASGDPAVYMPEGGGAQHIYITDGEALIQFIPDGPVGHVWNTRDLSKTAGKAASGTPAVYPPAPGSLPYIYITGPDMSLLVFVPDGPDWQAAHTAELSGPFSVNSNPAVYMPLNGGPPHLFIADRGGNLLEFIAVNLALQQWRPHNLTAEANADVSATGDPAVYVPADGSPPHIYICSEYGHLLEFIPNYTDGKYRHVKGCDFSDLTTATHSPFITGSPAVYTPWDGPQHVYVTGTGKILLDFVPDNLNGQLWSAYDRTASSNGPQVRGTPAVYRPLDRSKPQHIYITSPTGHLWEFTPNHRDGKYNHEKAWNALDLTVETGDFPADGSPAVYTPLDGSAQHVYVTWSQLR